MKTKRINWLLIGVAALAMGACSDEELMVEEGIENGKKLFTFEATMDADTRTTFNEDYSGLIWEEGDQLGFFTDAGDKNVASSKYVDGNLFKASLSSGASKVCAIYPYERVVTLTYSSNFFVSIPFKQIQKEAGILNASNIPMIAQTVLSSELASLKFEPLASLMAFNVYHSGDGIIDKLKSVTYSLGSDVTGDKYFSNDAGVYKSSNGVSLGSGSVGLATPYEIPRDKSNDKSGLVYLAVKPYAYTSGGTVIVTTDEDKAYYFAMTQSLDLKDPYKTQTIAINLAKASKVETLDNLNSHFDDSNFLKFLLENYDVNLDGKLSSFEVALVKDMDCSKSSIKLLKGIELFANLWRLTCFGNELSELDLNSNTKLMYLSCFSNQLTSLNINNCVDLTRLDCSSNQFTSMDVRGLMHLEELDCSRNQLTSLDISGCTGLTNLTCSYNQLTSLDVSGCTKLEWLDCYRNQLTSLDVSGCANAMTYVDARWQPKRYVTDEYGKIIVDEHGNQKEIPFEFYKAASQTIKTLNLPDGAETIEK